jgi:hypothetical protein
MSATEQTPFANVSNSAYRKRSELVGVRLEKNGKRAAYRENGYGKSKVSGTERLGQISAVRGVA